MIKRTLKRFSVGLLGVLFSLILMVVLTTWLLLGTATGNRWLLGHCCTSRDGAVNLDRRDGAVTAAAPCVKHAVVPLITTDA